ncbi:MAG: helix-turn-helix transcriptional regulator [Bacilli bacterium]|nr:helix-turn-helix transcriptional regulator [Bacilli bacterium]
MRSKLKEMRTSKKMTSKIMAQQLGISIPFYSQIENRQRRLTYEMAVKIASIFKTKPDKIFYDDYVAELERNSD